MVESLHYRHRRAVYIGVSGKNTYFATHDLLRILYRLTTSIYLRPSFNNDHILCSM